MAIQKHLTLPLSPHPCGRGFKEPMGGMSHSARIGRALLYRARSASVGAPTHSLPLFVSPKLARRDSTGGAVLRWCRRRGRGRFSH